MSVARWELVRAGFGQRMTLDALEALETADPEAVQRSLALTALVLSNVRRRAAGQSAAATGPFTPGGLFEVLGRGAAALTQLEEAVQAGRLESLAPGYADLMTLRRPGLGHQLTVGAHSLVAALSLAEQPEGAALARSRAQIEDLRTVQTAALAHDVGKVESGAGHAAARRRTCAGLRRAAGTDPGMPWTTWVTW